MREESTGLIIPLIIAIVMSELIPVFPAILLWIFLTVFPGSSAFLLVLTLALFLGVILQWVALMVLIKMHRLLTKEEEKVLFFFIEAQPLFAWTLILALIIFLVARYL
jgi:hypothetical protein